MANNVVSKSYNYNVICDVCGFKKKASEVRKRWDGYMVCDEDYETRHSLDFYRTRNDVHNLPFTRPDYDNRQLFMKLGTETFANDGSATLTNTFTITGTPGSQWQSVNFGPNLTAMAWVKINHANKVNQTIIGNTEVNTAGSFRLSVGGTGNQLTGVGSQPVMGIIASIGTGASTTVVAASTSAIMQVGKWHHVAWVRNETLQSNVLYLDGVPVTQFPIPGIAWQSVLNLSDTIWLGRTAAASTNAANISVADIRVFASPSTRAALSLNEIRRNMAESTPVLPEPSTYLQAWWKCNDNSTTIADSSGYSNNLTASVATDISWASKGIY